MARKKPPKTKAQTWDRSVQERCPMLAYACAQVLLIASTQALTEDEYIYCEELLEKLGTKIGELLGVK